MPADYNTDIVAIDSAMDCLEHVADAADSLRAAAGYDVSSAVDAAREKLSRLRRLLEEASDELERARALQEDDWTEDEDGHRTYHSNYDGQVERCEAEVAELSRKVSRAQGLAARAELLEEEWISDSAPLMRQLRECEDGGKRFCAAYLAKIQGVDGISPAYSGRQANPYTGERGYAVVIIDSSKYPESAEHVASAIDQGYPAYLTLDRSGAAANRRESLEGIRSRGAWGQDRDEYPPAAFLEGGRGAHVAAISASDNRGSGSSFARQLLAVPDGTRVRFRII